MALTIDDPPAPPTRPLWDGIYDFAWRGDNAKSFIACWVGMTILAGCACGFYGLFVDVMARVSEGGFMTAGWEAAVEGGARIFMALAAVSFLSSIFPAACFIRI